MSDPRSGVQLGDSECSRFSCIDVRRGSDTRYFEGTHLTMIALGDGQTKSLLKFSDSPHVDLRGGLIDFLLGFPLSFGSAE